MDDRIEERLIRIEDKVDKVVGHMGSIDVTLAKQHVSLEDHIKRTELLEQAVQPIQRKVNMADGVIKAIGFVAVIGGGIEGIIQLINYLGKL